jgi:exonuclease VII small subunit
MKLARVCSNKLSKAESRIEQLIVENGEIRTKPFTEGQFNDGKF